MADEANDGPVWLIPWEGETYEWRGIKDLTVGLLRHFKQWYGGDYGKVHAFNGLFFQGDVDAVACVVWACLKRVNKAPNSPNDLPDFSVGGLIGDTLLKGVETDPTEAEEPPTISDSTVTSTSSGESGSDQ